MATVYISGPMSGRQDRNFEAFHKAAAELKDSGHTVINPADFFDTSRHAPRSVYMKYAIKNIITADIVGTLPEWKESRGSRLEVEVARECGIPVVPYEQILSPQTLSKGHPTLWD